MAKMVLVHDALHGACCTAAALRKMPHSALARAPRFVSPSIET